MTGILVAYSGASGPMSTTLENLNLEEGKSEALRAALSCIAEASA
jgi:hypothetical protein